MIKFELQLEIRIEIKKAQGAPNKCFRQVCTPHGHPKRDAAVNYIQISLS